MTIIEAYHNLRSISPIGIVRDIVVADGDIIVELQKDQMMRGKDATGEDIAPSYRSDAYAEMKQRMNSQPDHGTPDLRLTGDFYNAFYFDTDTLMVTSSDPKTPMLVEKYSNNGKSPFFGLNDFFASIYRGFHNPKFWNIFWAQLKGEIPSI